MLSLILLLSVTRCCFGLQRQVNMPNKAPDKISCVVLGVEVVDELEL